MTCDRPFKKKISDLIAEDMESMMKPYDEHYTGLGGEVHQITPTKFKVKQCTIEPYPQLQSIDIFGKSFTAPYFSRPFDLDYVRLDTPSNRTLRIISEGGWVSKVNTYKLCDALIKLSHSATVSEGGLKSILKVLRNMLELEFVPSSMRNKIITELVFHDL